MATKIGNFYDFKTISVNYMLYLQTITLYTTLF